MANRYRNAGPPPMKVDKRNKELLAIQRANTGPPPVTEQQAAEKLTRAVIEIYESKVEEITVLDAKKSRPRKGKTPGRYRFVVQFNPSELKISSGETMSGGGMLMTEEESIPDAAGTGNAARSTAVEQQTWVNFRLIFDATDNEDAFLYEKATLDPSSVNSKTLLSDPASFQGVDYKAASKVHTVQYQVEGFMAAMMLGRRTISFSWGSLCYVGHLNSIDGEYTMFNPQGYPIRAEVNVGILCNGLEKDGTSQWDTQYHRWFEE